MSRACDRSGSASSAMASTSTSSLRVTVRRPIQRIGLDPDARYLVFCGGFNPWSDFDTLLRAVAIVARDHEDVRLALVGDGPERPRIEALAEELNLRDRVLVTGMIADRERVRDYLWAATLTLLAYRTTEVDATSASPIKLMEYLATGRAVVAIELPNVDELITDPGAGVLVKGEPEAFAAAVNALLGASPDAMGARGRLIAEERLSWDSVIERTLPLFELARPRGRTPLAGDGDGAPPA